MNKVNEISSYLDKKDWNKAMSLLNNIDIDVVDSDDVKVMKLFALSRLNDKLDSIEVLSNINKLSLTAKNRIRLNELIYIYIYKNNSVLYLSKYDEAESQFYSGFLILEMLRLAVEQYNKQMFLYLINKYKSLRVFNNNQKTRWTFLKIKGFYVFRLNDYFEEAFNNAINTITSKLNLLHLNLMHCDLMTNNITAKIPYNELYDMQFKKYTEEPILTVIFSHDTYNYTYFKRDFKGSVLFVTQKIFNSYYIFQPEILIDRLNLIVNINNINEIIFMGSSKGGYAAILFGKLFNDFIKSEISIKVCAFSPIVYLKHPGVISMPSAKLLYSLSKEYNFIANYLFKYENLASLFDIDDNNSRLEINLIFGKGHKRDSSMAELLRNHVNLHPIDTYLHSTICLLPPVKNFDNTSLEKFYKNAYSNDPDLAFLNNVEHITFDEFMNCANKYKDLLDYVLPSIKRT